MTDNSLLFTSKKLQDSDPEVYKHIRAELKRQQETCGLVLS